ncbi:hypothetical protein AVEN_98868-1, partial [Araneus ventricosus]
AVRDRRNTSSILRRISNHEASRSVSVQTVQRTVIIMGLVSLAPTRLLLLTAWHNVFTSWARQHRYSLDQLMTGNMLPGLTSLCFQLYGTPLY